MRKIYFCQWNGTSLNPCEEAKTTSSLRSNWNIRIISLKHFIEYGILISIFNSISYIKMNRKNSSNAVLLLRDCRECEEDWRAVRYRPVRVYWCWLGLGQRSLYSHPLFSFTTYLLHTRWYCIVRKHYSVLTTSKNCQYNPFLVVMKAWSTA